MLGDAPANDKPKQIHGQMGALANYKRLRIAGPRALKPGVGTGRARDMGKDCRGAHFSLT
jgi:hypothetical protein